MMFYVSMHVQFMPVKLLTTKLDVCDIISDMVAEKCSEWGDGIMHER